MRIIAGSHRGRKLAAPAGAEIRPTGDRAREALFGILEHGEPPVKGAGFLDLFAGTGAVGLEAFSRGAALVLLVERAREALALIDANLARLGRPGNVKVMAEDASRLFRARQAFDIAFLDPPYRSGLAAPALETLRHGWLAPEARIVVEIDGREDLTPPPGYELEQIRRYGAAKFVFLRARRGSGDVLAVSGSDNPRGDAAAAAIALNAPRSRSGPG
jgi:16S rRNA (guanine966-N2)-methyltransferase